MAEAALLTPLFFFILFGVLEFGGLFRDYLTLNNATASGARAAAIAGNAADADYTILQAIRKSSSALPTQNIRRIVVYRATNATTPVPSGCLTVAATPPAGVSGGSNPCNVYTGATLNVARSPAFTSCNQTLGSLQYFWCPTTRKYAAKPDAGNGPPDWLGIFIEIRHPWITGLFGQSITLRNTTVVKLEPASLV
jgi:Flp pilus assembly protein TadG